MDDLARSLADELGLPAAEIPADLTEPCPVPEDADRANRMLRSLAHLDAERDEVAEAYAREVQRLEQWREDADRPLRSASERLERALEQWGRAHGAATRKRTLKMPYGTIELRARRKRVEATTNQETLALIRKERPGLIRGKLEVDRTVVQSMAVAGSVLPPGDPAWEGIDPAEDEVREALMPGDEGEKGYVIEGVHFVVPLTDRVAVTPAGIK